MHALIPVKSLETAKRRLAKVLPSQVRKRLTVAMLGDVLDTLTHHPSIERVLVASPDRDVALITKQFNAVHLDESDVPCWGLNGTVSAVARRLAEDRITRLMVVHGDLPYLNREELSLFISTHAKSAAHPVTITPDWRWEGTNLLAWDPTSPFRAAYGPDSLLRHHRHCHAIGIIPNICVLRAAGLDIDLPEDLFHMNAHPDGLGPRTSTLVAARELAALTIHRAEQRRRCAISTSSR